MALASASGAVTGQIRSVAFSPDGVRIALIIKAPDGSSQLWIGTIVRTADGASVESLEPITPIGLQLTDVGLERHEHAVHDRHRPDPAGGYGIWSVQVDGSLLTARSTTGLPSAPDSITTSQFGFPWVSANTTVWLQRGQESSWTAPGGAPGHDAGHIAELPAVAVHRSVRTGPDAIRGRAGSPPCHVSVRVRARRTRGSGAAPPLRRLRRARSAALPGLQRPG